MKDDIMYENPLSKQHLLKLSSLGINMDKNSTASSKLDLSGPVAFDISMQFVSILNYSETVNMK